MRLFAGTASTGTRCPHDAGTQRKMRAVSPVTTACDPRRMTAASPRPAAARARSRLRRHPLLAAGLALGLLACAHAVAFHVFLVTDDTLDELSGIAASRLHPGALWTLEDGGNPAELVAIDDKGHRLAGYVVSAATNTDWEDLAPFQWQGRPHLLIADVGDNNAERPRVRLYAVPEPSALADGSIRPVWATDMVWSDGPRDCEAVAVDSSRGEILFISKRTLPPALDVAKLPAQPPGVTAHGDGSGAVIDPAPLRAEYVAPLSGVPVTPEADIRADFRNEWRHQTTAAALSPDGRQLAVMTYSEVLVYTRQDDDDWGAAVTGTPVLIALPRLQQAEAMAWSTDGKRLLVTGERTPTPVYSLPAPVR